MSVFAALLYSPIEPLEIYSSLHVFRKVFFPMITVSMRLEEIKTDVDASSNVVFFFWLGTSAKNFSQVLKFNQRNVLLATLRLRFMLQIPRRPSLFSLCNTIFSQVDCDYTTDCIKSCYGTTKADRSELCHHSPHHQCSSCTWVFWGFIAILTWPMCHL